ncbi:hypothetical protein Pelo_7800 [Pelomyxa schiedti]|nr:hypothetical protein Pelo_7800 [Pelomyxa schiedti]
MHNCGCLSYWSWLYYPSLVAPSITYYHLLSLGTTYAYLTFNGWDDLIRSSANEATALPSAMKCRLPNSPSTHMKEGSPARNATFLIDTPDFDRNSREDILIRLQSSIYRTTYEKPVNRKIEFNEPEYSPPKSQVQPKQQEQQALVPTNTQKIPVTKPTAITAPQPTIHQQ